MLLKLSSLFTFPSNETSVSKDFKECSKGEHNYPIEEFRCMNKSGNDVGGDFLIFLILEFHVTSMSSR